MKKGNLLKYAETKLVIIPNNKMILQYAYFDNAAFNVLNYWVGQHNDRGKPCSILSKIVNKKIWENRFQNFWTPDWAPHCAAVSFICTSLPSRCVGAPLQFFPSQRLPENQNEQKWGSFWACAIVSTWLWSWLSYSGNVVFSTTSGSSARRGR